jgi:hypothetical protein
MRWLDTSALEVAPGQLRLLHQLLRSARPGGDHQSVRKPVFVPRDKDGGLLAGWSSALCLINQLGHVVRAA